ncbi:MAG: terminase small subunit [Butyrivibrio sp.]|nr:terminase small subunit [Acetatifactor muris]MCM1561159.1 terminase small subunit [Butyrivibrio sp.]
MERKRGEIRENYQKAEADYMAGMKYKDIAKKYNTTINTVKSWKKRYDWNRKEGAPQKGKGCTQNKEGAPAHPEQMDDGTRETVQNKDLTPEQQMFCIYYIRTFNATQSYLKAYGCSYNVANAEGYKLLVKPCVKKEIERLKEIKRQMIVSGAEDIVELQMRIAFSDIGEYLTFGREPGVKGDVNVVRLNDSSEVDTQLIQEVKQGKAGVSVKLADKQKAMDWLSRYFLIHPEDKYKAEFDRRRVEPEDSDVDTDAPNGFVDALKAQAESVMEEAGEIIETEDIIQI